ncbi:MAG: hypothetical protein J6A36_02040 [Clostridia bacterium]|nr:hypothetical protein [Clostridia bacterium]
MNRISKFIVVLICIFIICLIIFLNKDFIIRQYFIAKIQNVDYEEYILTTLYNGKLKEKSYYKENFGIVQEYDENGERMPIVFVSDYNKYIEYQYNILKDDIIKRIKNENLKPNYINNHNLLDFLLDNENNYKFKYKGIEKINNQDCYVLEFENAEHTITNMYLNKEFLYTAREENYILNNSNEHIIYDYILDLELKEKDLFEGIIEE